jgi:N-acetylglucosamine-6-sulfatase
VGERVRANARPRLAPPVLALLLVVLATGSVVGGNVDLAQTTPRAKPNVVLIVTDDQRWDSVDQMPRLNAATEWARFSNAFVDEPQCCPSRASIFTGRYPQNTGVETLRDGKDMDENRTIATMLQDAGYRTGHYGKYLNGHPQGRGLYTPPGWSEFVATFGPNDYYNYTLSEDDRAVSYGSEPSDYKTDVLAAMGRRFIATTKRSTPFFLYLAFNAPHTETGGRIVPASRNSGSCASQTFEHPPNLNARDNVSEPAWMNAEKPKNPSDMQSQRAATCEALRGVDDAVMSMVAGLERVGRLENTYLIFTSDNGYAFGEHRLKGKGDLYEASVRVPLLVRGPDVKPTTIDRLTSNVDLVSTILDWANVSPPRAFLDGTSFADNLRDEPPTHDPQEVLLRGCRTARGPNDDCGGYPSDMGFNWGLRTATHKYIEYPDGYVQLFDLSSDPWELTNLGADPAQTTLIAELHTRLKRLRSR